MVCSYKHCWQYPCFDSQTEQERAFEFGRIFQEIETPTVMEQLHQLYAPVLEQDYVRFLLAVYHANELPDLAVGQRLKIFRHYYKETPVNFLTKPESQKLEKPNKNLIINNGVKWTEL